MAHGHSIDEYLETIYFLAFPVGEYRSAGSGGAGGTGTAAIAARVAEMLGVSRPSAGEMLERLEAEGLVERGEHKEAILTPAGRARAEKAVRKHRIIECWLTGFLGYTPAQAHVHADDLGDSFTDDMIERMHEKLGRPGRCPHGWPVETAFEQEENRGLAALAELAPGEAGTIVRLAEHDGDLLHRFYDAGLVPGTAVEVTGPGGGAEAAVEVRVDGRPRTLAAREAAGLYVRRAAPLTA